MKFQIFSKTTRDNQKISNPECAPAKISNAFGKKRPLCDVAGAQALKEFLIYRDLKSWHSIAKAFGQVADQKQDIEKRYSPGKNIAEYAEYMKALMNLKMAMAAITSAGSIEGRAENTDRLLLATNANSEFLKISLDEASSMLALAAGSDSRRISVVRTILENKGEAILVVNYLDNRTWEYAKSIRFSTMQQLHESVCHIYAKTAEFAGIFRNAIQEIKNRQSGKGASAQPEKSLP